MTKNLKTKLTRDEVKQLLELYNKLDSSIDNIVECLDVDISTLRDLRSAAFDLQQLFNFRSKINEDGNPSHWLPKVLPDEPDAWFHKSTE
tara:strand:+ start:1180 stop:1449 length:270 start_codon:yes stop_codon:yes gene_type:complete